MNIRHLLIIVAVSVLLTITSNPSLGQALVINEKGNVGIGTNKPTHKLSVQLNTRSEGTNAPIRFGDNYGFAFLGVGKNRIFLATQKGNESFTIDQSNGTVSILRLFVITEALKSDGGSWKSFSDGRLKDIRQSYRNGLSAINKLNPVIFSYKKENVLDLPDDKVHVGLIAQEVQEVIPEAVTEGENGYLMLNNDPIIWTMLNAIKEQQKIIVRQETELDDMNSRMAKLESSVRKLKQLLISQEEIAVDSQDSLPLGR